MPTTNKLNLPQPIVEALKRDPYNPGNGHFSATEIIAPPKIKVLERRHKEDIFEDVSDKLYSLYGQSIHYILERAGLSLVQSLAEAAKSTGLPQEGGVQVEKRYYAQYDRWNVSAQIDCLTLDNACLDDYKFTTTYSFQKNMDGTMDIKKEWYAQLNIQADILRRNGMVINRLRIIGLLRDWQPSKAATDPLYPQSQIVVMEIPMAAPEKIQQYILHRCELHQTAKDQANDDLIPECSKEERWEEETKFALMKNGGKRATKVLETRAEAEDWLSKQNDAANFHIDTRPGFARRCMGVGGKVYCPAQKFCHHYRSLVAGLQAQQQAAA